MKERCASCLREMGAEEVGVFVGVEKESTM